jgi:hypothetical protein
VRVLSSRADDPVHEALALGLSLRREFLAANQELVDALAPDRVKGSEGVVLISALGAVALSLQWLDRDGRPHVELISRVVARA